MNTSLYTRSNSNKMILLYRVITFIFYPFFVLFTYFRIFLKKEDSKRFKEKIFSSSFNIKRKENSKLIWFHAASIGEFKSIIPIMKELNKKNNFEFLITTTTLSSSKIAKVELKKFRNAQHRFFPLDVNFLMSKFLKLWRPKIIFLVDSEIWPNLILKSNEQKIPIVLINARITEKSFNKWILFPKTAKKIFNLIYLNLTADMKTKNYLSKLNARNVFYNGNIKFIGKININKLKNLNQRFLVNKKFWLAASTHSNEEVFCLKTHLEIKKKYKDIITIIAPRHINRVNEIRDICNYFKLKSQILNKNETIQKNKEVIILNSFGVLQNYFKFVKSVFIGKSIVKELEKVGGQNPLEAAKLGCKVYHGPYTNNFKEVYQILKKNHISKKISGYRDLSKNLINDLKKPTKSTNKISTLINNLGQKTLTDTMKKIDKFLINEVK